MNGDSRQKIAGRWYWVAKAVIQEHAAEVGYLPIAVYHLMASMADQSESCYPSQGFIAKRIGCSHSSVSRAVKLLLADGLIAVTRQRGGCSHYRLLAVGGSTDATDPLHLCNQPASPTDTNKTEITRHNNNVVHVDISHTSKEGNSEEARIRILAMDIAQGLGDTNPTNLRLFLDFSRKYPESLLREALSQVRQMPERLIRKSRTALFIGLMNRHARENQ